MSVMILPATATPDERARHLLDQMTTAEKVAQLYGVWTTGMVDAQWSVVPERAQKLIPHGVGHFTRIGASTLLPPVDSARLANRLQRFLIEQTRLGIPAIVHEESCAGYMARGATTFPQAIGMASTWEPELVQAVADVIRVQMRAVGAHHALAPVLDVARDPRWGRVEETFGEDPFLITAIGTAYIRGLQGTDLKTGVIGTAKHFAAHGWPEGGRNWSPVNVGERDFREIFLMPFRAAIQSAQVESVMNAYHEMDGIPCIASRQLMVDILRDELGFDGTIVSDYGAILNLYNYHFVAESKLEAAHMALLTGIDVELPKSDCYDAALIEAVERGDIPVDLVNACAFRVLRQKFKIGLFENPYTDERRVTQVFQTPDQLTLTRHAAAKSIILLKNDANLLPLSPDLRHIAVIGPSSDSIRVLQGDYSYPSHLMDIYSPEFDPNAPNPFQMITGVDWDEHFPPSVTVLEGIRGVTQAQIHYAKGCDMTGDDTSGFAEAVDVARQSQVAIVVVGDHSGLSRSATSGEARDDVTLELPGVQRQLIEAIYTTGTPVVVVLINGRVFALSWIAAHIPAVVEAWEGGQQGGAAIADVLFGKVNPGGKLPVSFPRAVGQLPVYYNHKRAAGRSNWYSDYRTMPVAPLYPFGHGLSYTTFEYSPLRLSSDTVNAADTIHIEVDLRNTGDRAGEEVAQLYISDPIASVTRPVKALKGFKRVSLQPGEQKTIVFAFDVQHTAFYDLDMQYSVEPGQIDLLVGSSSEDIRSAASIQIIGVKSPARHVSFTDVQILGV